METITVAAMQFRQFPAGTAGVQGRLPHPVASKNCKYDRKSSKKGLSGCKKTRKRENNESKWNKCSWGAHLPVALGGAGDQARLLWGVAGGQLLLFGTLEVVRNFNLSASSSAATRRVPRPERAEWKLSCAAGEAAGLSF